MESKDSMGGGGGGGGGWGWAKGHPCPLPVSNFIYTQFIRVFGCW